MTLEYNILIHATPPLVWNALTSPDSMRRWMGEPDMIVDVHTDWTVGGPIVVRGFHHAPFENRGRVVEFQPPLVLRYTQLSSLSCLPDEPESYSLFEFQLAPVDDGTLLSVTLRGFPTESIFKHLDLYWRVTIAILKTFVETGVPTCTLTSY